MPEEAMGDSSGVQIGLVAESLPAPCVCMFRSAVGSYYCIVFCFTKVSDFSRDGPSSGCCLVVSSRDE
jgi:hypothetical protein